MQLACMKPTIISSMENWKKDSFFSRVARPAKKMFVT